MNLQNLQRENGISLMIKVIENMAKVESSNLRQKL